MPTDPQLGLWPQTDQLLTTQPTLGGANSDQFGAMLLETRSFTVDDQAIHNTSNCDIDVQKDVLSR